MTAPGVRGRGWVERVIWIAIGITYEIDERVHAVMAALVALLDAVRARST